VYAGKPPDLRLRFAPAQEPSPQRSLRSLRGTDPGLGLSRALRSRHRPEKRLTRFSTLFRKPSGFLKRRPGQQQPLPAALVEDHPGFCPVAGAGDLLDYPGPPLAVDDPIANTDLIGGDS